MANRTAIRTVMFVLALACLSATMSIAKEKKIAKKDLPKEVASAFSKAYPNAVINGTSKETKKKTTYYEIESVEGKTHRDLLYKADGTIAEIEETIALTDAPPALQESITKDHPKASVAKVEKLTKGEKISYEVQIKEGKKSKELKFDSTGKPEKNDEGEEEDED